MKFLQFDFETSNAQETEMLVALLAEQGFNGFEEDGNFLIAFVPTTVFDIVEFEKTLERFSILAYSKTEIENINWNQKWENEFEPVLVDQFVAIRAHFHQPIKSVQHEIIITPKMSFGTGHHATTFMMIQLMKDLDFTGKKVFDFGTGTGVLAILAEKSGATEILAIDNDEWSIHNANENCVTNNCQTISLLQMDKVPLEEKFDIILANINLNVILSTISSLSIICNPNAKILLSGFLKTDKEILVKAIEAEGLKIVSILNKGEWIAILSSK